MLRSRRWLVAVTLLAALGCEGRKPSSETSTGRVAAPGSSGPANPVAASQDGGGEALAPPDVATGRHGAISSAEKLATAAGLEVLKRGGNAVDAAIAVGFALGVTHPIAGNIGGGGFMVVHLADGKSTAIDFRETAPGKASRDMYLDANGAVTDESRLGPRAAGIPGDVAGFGFAHARYGSRPWKQLLAPAIRLATEGHELDASHAADLQLGTARTRAYQATLAADPTTRPALRAAVEQTLAWLTHPDGSAYAAGEVWKQPDLGATLAAIAERGPMAFYRGELAARLVAGVQAMGGIWSAKDLARYKVIERTPLSFEYHGHQLITMPPPSAGGVTLRQILVASDALGLAKLPWDSVERIHLYVEALRRVFADRNLVLADPGFVDIPMKTLLADDYVVTRMADIAPDRATPSAAVAAGVELGEKPQTTHFSVIDGNGMAVAITYTLNGHFGANVQVPGTGVTLNNEMDDFTAKVGAPNMFGLIQGPQNAIAPGKRMVSSMTPTIVTRDGKLRAVCGSMGGPTIITAVAQIVLLIVDHGRTLDQAVAATRIHHQWMPDLITHEESLPPATTAALAKLGHKLEKLDSIGIANCIEVDPTGGLRAVADGRGGGDADAY